ncbi:DUF3564 domain-containing protein [Burkholderia sp. FERM BP-3421]|uniref:DUF3564 family protein n=1 Tax=Burkholderia sp. FERM BP-3421 TaxID=1494466 RepID=UPI00235F4242|nr:DUF3564 family protein [Burkholderia sp. FERM BP-3421]WDD91525.1 DUF3564 domain-containing protein [Burkholderia sp. FERM BP-3421]
MRITVHLDAFDRHPNTYAILWFDKSHHRWSREGHAGLSLPAGGLLACVHGATRLAAQPGGEFDCVLEGLDLTHVDGPFEGETGIARWRATPEARAALGVWHVQCIDADRAPSA